MLPSRNHSKGKVKEVLRHSCEAASEKTSPVQSRRQDSARTFMGKGRANSYWCTGLHEEEFDSSGRLWEWEAKLVTAKDSEITKIPGRTSGIIQFCSTGNNIYIDDNENIILI